jgi:hypothetical protein
MPLVNTIKSEDQGTPAARDAIEPYVPPSDQQIGGTTVLVRKAKHLDVDGVLARSIPTPGAYAIKDIKTAVLR